MNSSGMLRAAVLVLVVMVGVLLHETRRLLEQSASHILMLNAANAALARANETMAACYQALK